MHITFRYSEEYYKQLNRKTRHLDFWEFWCGIGGNRYCSLSQIKKNKQIYC